MPTPEADKKRLAKKVSALSKALANLAKSDDEGGSGPGATTFQEFIEALRDPGFTTPAEFMFVSAIIESMIEHTDAMRKLKAALIRGSKAVIKARRV